MSARLGSSLPIAVLKSALLNLHVSLTVRLYIHRGLIYNDKDSKVIFEEAAGDEAQHYHQCR